MDTASSSSKIREELDRIEALIRALDRPAVSPRPPSARRPNWLKEARKVCRFIAIAGIVALLWPEKQPNSE